MSWLFAPRPTMVTADEALDGSPTPILPNPGAHAVLHTPLDGPWPDDVRHIILGMGCFWGAEKVFYTTPGVYCTSVGYAGGFTTNPSYEQVCTGRTGHAEVVRVTYRPQDISLTELLTMAVQSHDPTQGFRQGNDVGTQYRSVIYLHPDTATTDAPIVSAVLTTYAGQLAAHGFGDITTEVAELKNTPAGEYFLAEDYHQQYLVKNPAGYCPDHGTGVACPMPAN